MQKEVKNKSGIQAENKEKDMISDCRENKQMGKQSIVFTSRPVILAAASVVGKKEGQGPLGELFDKVSTDDMFGAGSWEEAESALQKETVQLCSLHSWHPYMYLWFLQDKNVVHEQF